MALTSAFVAKILLHLERLDATIIDLFLALLNRAFQQNDYIIHSIIPGLNNMLDALITHSDTEEITEE